MARGWESKSVEDQQDAAAARRATAEKPSLSDDEAARRQRLDALRLSRARVLADLQRACRPEHRGMLEQALADIDARIIAAQEA
ncbi:hypothetical protein TBR22_A31800 [Luteitalea sp. TBR-22]|uniref:hypothetical protein n=1 Tax=Luteitalea sp. TBR-22 TaxID=2802971 RepID=UPI001AF10344|nr:hypothetical protein [Luteitalea sp. TBR-22]BCS33952.1 hypothetical protein TBR22_A31800 [Luteitalea sp. TBR-22]